MPPLPPILKKTIFLWCSVLWVWGKFGGRPCVFVLCFHFSLMLWSCSSRQAPPPLPITPEDMTSFLLSSGGGSCWSASQYSSVKFCLWTLDEQLVLTVRIRKKVSESCPNVIQVLQGCCCMPAKPSLLQPGQVCFPELSSQGKCFNPWNHLVGLQLNMFQLCVGNLVKISTTWSVLLCAVRWVECTNLSSNGYRISKAMPVLQLLNFCTCIVCTTSDQTPHWCILWEKASGPFLAKALQVSTKYWFSCTSAINKYYLLFADEETGGR